MQYEPFGPLKQATLGNTLSMTNNWGNDGRLASRRLYVTSGGVNRSLLSYAYDNDDNIIGITDGVNATNTLAYQYDIMGRLSRATLASTSTATHKRSDFLYDANGNRTRNERRTNATDVNPTESDIFTRTVGTNRTASIALPSGTRSITPDARGNLSNETRPGGINVTAGYDGHGRLISYARSGDRSLTHVYNGLDDRVATTTTPSGGAADTRRFLTAPDGRTMGEYGSSATDVKAEFIWMSPEVGDPGSRSGAGSSTFGGDDGLGGYTPLAIVNGTTLSWTHGNHMGVPITYTNSSGAIIAAPTGCSAPGFPGQSMTFADLYYNRYRDYDPSTGGYIQADPIGLAGGANPYSYAMGNPVRYMDPDGLRCLNMFPTNEWGFQIAAAAHCNIVDPTNSPRTLHILGHGNPDGFCPYSRVKCLSMDQFYDEYSSQFGNPKDIFLWSCYGGLAPTGGISPAKILANRSHVPVRAFDNLTFWNKNGFGGSGGRQPTFWEAFFDNLGYGELHPTNSAGVPRHNGLRNYNDLGTEQVYKPDQH
jgi:RHS repeat-associated protein